MAKSDKGKLKKPDPADPKYRGPGGYYKFQKDKEAFNEQEKKAGRRPDW